MSGAETLPESVRPPDLERTNDPYGVLKNRDFLLYLVSRFISSFGQQMLAVTVGWEIYERTNSKLALGFVGLVQMVPMLLFVFPAGHMADNYSRKKIMLWMQLLFGVACAGLTLVSAFGGKVYWMYACLFILGTARTYIWPASASFMPQLVPRHQFAKAVTWNSGAFQVSAVTGPVAGGILVALTHTAVWVYAVNCAAALVCLVLVWLVHTRHKIAVKERMSLKSVAAGLKFVHRNKVVLGSITLDLFAVLLGGATRCCAVCAKDIFARRSKRFGAGCRRALPPWKLFINFLDTGASTAAAKGGADPALVGGWIWAGDHRVWFFHRVLVVVHQAVFLRHD